MADGWAFTNFWEAFTVSVVSPSFFSSSLAWKHATFRNAASSISEFTRFFLSSSSIPSNIGFKKSISFFIRAGVILFTLLLGFVSDFSLFSSSFSAFFGVSVFFDLLKEDFFFSSMFIPPHMRATLRSFFEVSPSVLPSPPKFCPPGGVPSPFLLAAAAGSRFRQIGNVRRASPYALCCGNPHKPIPDCPGQALPCHHGYCQALYTSCGGQSHRERNARRLCTARTIRLHAWLLSALLSSRHPTDRNSLHILSTAATILSLYMIKGLQIFPSISPC